MSDFLRSNRGETIAMVVPGRVALRGRVGSLIGAMAGAFIRKTIGGLMVFPGLPPLAQPFVAGLVLSGAIVILPGQIDLSVPWVPGGVALTAMAIPAALSFLLYRSGFGRYLSAICYNGKATFLSGVSTPSVLFAAFAIAAVAIGGTSILGGRGGRNITFGLIILAMLLTQSPHGKEA